MLTRGVTQSFTYGLTGGDPACADGPVRHPHNRQLRRSRSRPLAGAVNSRTPACRNLRQKWQELWERKLLTWTEMLAKAPECSICRQERQRRCQVHDGSEASCLRLREDFAGAPYVHPYNQPKYQAQICHAVNFARASQRKVLWCIAQDWPLTA